MTTAVSPLASNDLEHVLQHTADAWPVLAANQRLALGIEATVLSRDPDALARRAPHLAPGVRWVRGPRLVRSSHRRGRPHVGFTPCGEPARNAPHGRRSANPGAYVNSARSGTRNARAIAASS